MQGAAGCGGRGWRGSGQRGVAPSAVHEWWRNSRGEAGDARRSRACARFPRPPGRLQDDGQRLAAAVARRGSVLPAGGGRARRLRQAHKARRRRVLEGLRPKVNRQLDILQADGGVQRLALHVLQGSTGRGQYRSAHGEADEWAGQAEDDRLGWPQRAGRRHSCLPQCVPCHPSMDATQACSAAVLQAADLRQLEGGP